MISLARLKLLLGFDDPSAEHADDELLEALRDGALAFVQAQTGRYFGLEAETTEILTGNGSRNLWLVGIPHTAEDAEPVLVTEQIYPGADAADVIEFEVRVRPADQPRQGWLVRWGGYKWTLGYEYAVTYTHGYEEDGLPADVEQVIAELVSLRYDASSEGMRSETIGGYSYTRFSEADLATIPGATETLAAWKVPVLA